MKPGSLITLVKPIDLNGVNPKTISHVKWLPVLGDIYTLKGIFPEKGNEYVIVEERSIGYAENPTGELGIRIDHWKELQPPMIIDIEELCAANAEI